LRSAYAVFLFASLPLTVVSAAPHPSVFDGPSRAASEAFSAHFESLSQDVPEARAAALLPARTDARFWSESLLESAHYAAQANHNPLSYDMAREAMFSYVDNVVVDGSRGVVAAYSWIFVPGSSDRGGSYREQGDANRDGYVDSAGMNAEHVWPQSYFKKRSPMRSDLHHLMPTFMHPNSVRGRMPFAEVSDHDADYSNSAGAKRGSNGFEPPDVAKGRVARAMFYFYTRYLGYNIIPSSFARDFWNNRIELLLRWNREYPPDAWEIQRNERVEIVQGNRNPFIDDPTLAERIGAAAFRMPAGSGLYASSGPAPGRAPRP